MLNVKQPKPPLAKLMRGIVNAGVIDDRQRKSLMPLLFTDHPESMETAKRIIGGHLKVDHAELARIAQATDVGKWPRIAAMYTLGFLGDKTFSPVLRRILADSRNDLDIRSYAAEALGNIGDQDAAMLLKEILRHAPPWALRESCEYALEELEVT
jgi:HEAT repeat protein